MEAEEGHYRKAEEPKSGLSFAREAIGHLREAGYLRPDSPEPTLICHVWGEPDLDVGVVHVYGRLEGRTNRVYVGSIPIPEDLR